MIFFNLFSEYLVCICSSTMRFPLLGVVYRSYTQFSLLHRKRTYWRFRGLLQSPAKTLLGFGSAIHEAVYCVRDPCPTFTCDSPSTAAIFSALVLNLPLTLSLTSKRKLSTGIPVSLFRLIAASQPQHRIAVCTELSHEPFQY